MIGAALGLLVLFIIFTSRNSGSHPRDLRTKSMETQGQDELRPIIKEPPGKWDPTEDQFRQQHIKGDGTSGTGSGVLKDQGEGIRKPSIEEDELKRKSPKKGNGDTVKPAVNADKLQEQPESPKRPQKGGEGSGAVVLDDDSKGQKKEGLEVKEYDPAEGLIHRTVNADYRFGSYSHSSANNCIPLKLS